MGVNLMLEAACIRVDYGKKEESSPRSHRSVRPHSEYEKGLAFMM
jgi:hypothetical protein